MSLLTFAKRLITDVPRGLSLSGAVRRIQRHPSGWMPDEQTLQQLHFGWGNEGFSASVEFMHEVGWHALQAQGPILECGSGATTILTGLLAGRRGIRCWALEHDTAWADRVNHFLLKFQVPGVTVCVAPLRRYGDYVWYDPPLRAIPLSFAMVVCDGPPTKTTHGGRYGLLPVMVSKLRSESVILFDDAGSGGAALQRWRSEWPLYLEYRHHPGKTFAIVRQERRKSERTP